MCGIAGIVGPEATNSKLDAMLVTQEHRGPDFTGKWCEESKVALGHNRLSIIDLSEAANQPFFSEDERFCLVFNGEIYNYLEIREELRFDFQFHTSSDTEVLLKSYLKWGVECLEKFNGMFAFAIWDKEDQKLFAARDRFGVKPFNYSLKNNTIYFSSEIPPLWAAGIEKVPNLSVWADYFKGGKYGNPDETFWKGIFQLDAGSYMIYESGSIQIRQWYDFHNRVIKLQECHEPNEEDYILDLLRDAVKLRFRADVPVGFNLSGGLDSSTLLALVAETNPNSTQIEAFTFYTGDDKYDELPWVEKMLQGRGFHLNKCLISDQDVPALTEGISKNQAEPFGGIPTLAYAQLFKKAREKGVLVLLDGQGSDEAWAGYDYYVSGSQSLVQGVKTSPVKPEVLNQDFLNNSRETEFPRPFGDDLLDKQFRDIFYTKIPRALRFNDRISMAYGTELREPFLDYRLVEYVFSRPKDFKIKNGNQKWLLRKIASKYLGNELTLAPKRPLQTPQREWMGSELKDWVDSQIKALAQAVDWFDKSKLEQSWEDYKRGDQDNSFFLWQWVNAAELLK